MGTVVVQREKSQLNEHTRDASEIVVQENQFKVHKLKRSTSFFLQPPSLRSVALSPTPVSSQSRSIGYVPTANNP